MSLTFSCFRLSLRQAAKLTALSLFAGALGLPSLSLAQDAPSVRTNTTEIGFFGGVSHGIDAWRAMYGGNVAYSVAKWLLPYGEFSYFPGFQRRETLPSGTLSYATPLYDLHAGVHVRAPIAESHVVPYGVLGMGVIHSNFKGTASLKTAPDLPATGIPGYKEVNSDFTVNFGGGLRFYLGQRWGFRLEAKTYRPVTGRYSNFFYKAEGGLFLQIH